MAITLADADRAIAAAERAGVLLQVGFNRRFAPDSPPPARPSMRAGSAPAAAAVVDPRPGPVRRRPGPRAAVDDLPRDAHPRLRHAVWLNPGAQPVEVHAFADALVAPAPKRRPARHRRRHHPLRQRRDRDRRSQLQRPLRLRRARRGVRLRGHGHRGHGPQHRHDPASTRTASTSTPPAATPTCCTRRTRGDHGVRRGRARPGGRRPCPARPPAPRWPIALAAVESVETGAAVTL